MTFVAPIRHRNPVRSKRRNPMRSEIAIPRQGDRCSVGSDEPRLEMLPGSASEHNQDLLGILKKVRLKIQETGSIQLSPSVYKTVMRELRDIGLSAYMSLGDDFVEKFDALEQEAGRLGLILTIRSDTFPLLWEMLYTGSSRGEVEAEKFWGFHHRVARFHLGARSSNEEEIDADCDFLFCYDHRLSHWQQERDEVERLVSRRFRFHLLEDVFPGPRDTDSTGNLADCFIDMLALLELGLLHLACHCLPDPDRSGVLSSELAFSWQSSQVHVTLHELKAAQRDFGFSLQPLVFLNACKTMTNPEHLIHGDSFPGGFLRFGASGVIATACDVPDQFAAAFAAKFYENLCKDIGGCSPTVSDALLKTRLFFINPPYYNPMGLAYGLYGRNDLHIEWEPWIGEEEGMADEDD